MNFTKFRELTRLEQTLFGLPFLFAGVLLPFLIDASFSLEWLLKKGGWIVPAFLSARLSGMAFNQLLDRRFDALNPRTQKRPLPSGRIQPHQALKVAWIFLFLFLLFCSFINLLCVTFGLIAALLISLYSYVKRWHAGCHFVLGAIHFLSPLMVWIALSGQLAMAPVLLGLVAFFSITANDILYAFQDEEFDRQQGLHSFPAKFGKKISMIVAGFLHLGCLAMLIGLGFYSSLPGVYFLAPLSVLGGLVFFYWKVNQKIEERRFFFLNTLISGSTFLGIFMSFIWRVM